MSIYLTNLFSIMILLISSVLSTAQDDISDHIDSMKSVSADNRNILTLELGRSDYFTYNGPPYKNILVKYKKKLYNNRDISFFINYAKEKDEYFPYYDLIIKNPGGMLILAGLYLSSYRKYFAFNFGLTSIFVRNPDPFDGDYYFVPIPTCGFSVGLINKLYVDFDSIDKELFKIPVAYSITALFKIAAISIHYYIDHPNMQFYAGISGNSTDENWYKFGVRMQLKKRYFLGCHYFFETVHQGAGLRIALGYGF